MSCDLAIRVDGVSKCFEIYDNPRDRLLQMLFRSRRQYYREFWALRDISFEVPRGETVGIVGRNGSGKSTLLQIICGTLSPTAGSVMTNGRVGALLELGSGFNPEFTGRENVYMSGAVLGLTRKELDERFDDILSFADIGEFIDQPVKSYSSGMVVRLAFAVQSQVQPDVLIVDEALAVGDARFQAKCFDRLKRLKDNGTSILLVTHSGEQIVNHCSRAILLNAGSVVVEGKPRTVMNRYMDLLFGRERALENDSDSAALLPDTPADQNATSDTKLDFSSDVYATRFGYNAHEYRWGDGAATLLDFMLKANNEEFPTVILSGAKMHLSLAVRFNMQIVRPILGIEIRTKEGVTVGGTNSELVYCEEMFALGAAESTAVAAVDFDLDLAAGDYFISLGISSRRGDDIIPHDRRYDSIHMTVSPTPTFYGLVDLKLAMTAATR